MADLMAGYRGNATYRRRSPAAAFVEPGADRAPSAAPSAASIEVSPGEPVGWVCAHCGGPVELNTEDAPCRHDEWRVDNGGAYQAKTRCPGLRAEPGLV
jgi:hypothetical protein